LVERISRHAESNAIAPAQIGLGGITTYQDLARAICAIANHLDDRRVPRGTKVLFNIGSPDLRVTALIAALTYGVTPLIAQPETLKGNLTWDLVLGATEPLRPDIAADITIDQSVVAGRFADTRQRSFAERDDADLAYVAETSGTTGRPKLVGVTQGQFRRRVQRTGRFPPRSRVFCSIGTASKFALQINMEALATGCATINAALDVALNLRLINLFRPSFLLVTPAFIERALDLMDASGVRCPSVTEIQLTGATFTPELLARMESRFTARVQVGYGSSEVEGPIARGFVTAATYRKGWAGHPNPDLKVTVTGTKQAPGSIVIASDGDRLVRSIVEGKVVKYNQPTYTLPDIGYLEDSVLYLAGRSDEVYNSGGNIKAYSLIAEEIAGLLRTNDVAIVSGAPLGDDRDLIIGIVASRQVNLDSLTAQLVDRLQMAQSRKHFRLFQLAVIPRHPETGKVDRTALIRAYQHQSAAAHRGVSAMEGVT
jgi:acyl-coenzyme A synthetase/AMP-(fatty) acid ligase